MSVNQEAKKEQAVSIKQDLLPAKGVFVFLQLGLDATATLALRREMRAAGVKVRVGKNTILKRAIEGTHLAGLEPYLKGPTALAYSDDAVGAAKVAAAFAKKNDKFKIVAGAMDSQILDAKAVATLATLPSLDELRGKLIGLILAPATKIAGVLQAPAGQLARVMAARGRQDA